MTPSPLFWDPLRFAVGTLTVVPVPAPRALTPRNAGRGLALAPLIGAVLGGAGAGVNVAAREVWSPFIAAGLAIGLLALLTRGLHLDGLADAADGLGARSLDVMRRSDIGPFGVVTVVLILLLQVAATAAAPWWALAVAVPIGRLLLVWACSRGIPAARPDGLGAMVAGTVPRWVPVLWTVVLAAAWPWATLAALLVAGLFFARLLRRFGGVTGDVLGAVCEVGTTAALLALAV